MLVTCPECEARISSEADPCPKCGLPDAGFRSKENAEYIKMEYNNLGDVILHCPRCEISIKQHVLSAEVRKGFYGPNDVKFYVFIKAQCSICNLQHQERV